MKEVSPPVALFTSVGPSENLTFHRRLDFHGLGEDVLGSDEVEPPRWNVKISCQARNMIRLKRLTTHPRLRKEQDPERNKFRNFKQNIKSRRYQKPAKTDARKNVLLKLVKNAVEKSMPS